jgi:hypothetical protein
MKRLSLILLLFISTFTFAQSDFEGTITMDISYENLNEQMKAAESMLPSATTVEVRDGMAKTTTPSGMGETVVISNISTGEMLTLQNMMGNRIAYKITAEQLQAENETPEVEYLDETKEIAGYTCKKAIVTVGEIETEIYYTEELPNISSQTTSGQIDGFPMQTTISIPNMFTQVQTVNKIEEEKVKKIKMEIPEGYTEMSYEELKKMGAGGM